MPNYVAVAKANASKLEDALKTLALSFTGGFGAAEVSKYLHKNDVPHVVVDNIKDVPAGHTYSEH